MSTPETVLDFWFTEGPDTFRQAWFTRDDAFDATVRDRLGALSDAACAGSHGAWADTAEGALALAILMD